MEYFIKAAFPDARKLSAHEAPGILAYVEEVARKSGCSAPPIYLNPSHDVNAAVHFLGRGMIINQGAITKMGSHLAGTPSVELKGILAHEMGHWANSWTHFGPMVAVIGGAGLIAGMSVYLHDLTTKQQAKDKAAGKETGFMEALHEVTDEMKNQGLWKNFKNYFGYYSSPDFSFVGKTDTQPSEWEEYSKRQAKNIVANMAGFMVAVPLCKPISLRNEYDADAFAARLVGGDNYIKMLNTLHEEIHAGAHDVAKKINNPHATEGVIKSVKSWFTDFVQKNMMAHPTWEQRVAAVQKLATTSHIHI